MKNAFLLLSMGLFLGMNSLARITDNQIVFKHDAGVLKIETKKGFHLNAEGPANATFDGLEALFKPSPKTEKLFAFKVPENTKKAKISFYVCDDKKTVCEQHQQEVNLAELKAGTAATPAKTSKIVTDAAKDPGEVSVEQLLISQNGKPTLLVFSAPWCPACIRMQTETYPVGNVPAQLKKVNFVKLNSDLPENYDLSEKLHVKAIPTIILLNTDGEEVFRWLDFQPPGAFAKSLNQEIKKVATSKNSLEKRAALGDADAISMVGQLYYNALYYSQAVRWLSLSKKAEDQKLKLAAEVGNAQDSSEAEPTEYLRTLEKAMVLTSSSIDQIRWMVDWIEKKKEMGPLSNDIKTRAQNLLVQIENKIKNRNQLVKEFKQSTFGEAAGFEVAEANLMRSRIFEALEQKIEKESSDQKVIQSLKNRKFTVAKPGEMLIGVAYLREGGEKKRVDKMYNDLIKKFPKTYVYYEKYSRYLLKEKDLDKSLANAEQAVQYAEGNQPQLFLLKARVLKELNQKEKVLETVNAAHQLKDIQHVRFKKTVAQLNKLKEEAASTK